MPLFEVVTNNAQGFTRELVNKAFLVSIYLQKLANINIFIDINIYENNISVICVILFLDYNSEFIHKI